MKTLRRSKCWSETADKWIVFALMVALGAFYVSRSTLPDGHGMLPWVATPITFGALLTAVYHLWRNGMYPTLGLPATASPDEVIARVFEQISFAEGRVTKHRILEGERTGWWSRVYDPRPSR